MTIIMKLLLTIMFIFCSFAYSIGQQGGSYQIIGSVSGFPDNALLYLEVTPSSEEPETIDSVLVQAGRFSLEGQLKSKAGRALIRTADYSDYTIFWLEPASIRFTAQKGKFRDAIITGSGIQDEQNALAEFLNTVPEKKRDAYRRQYIREHPNSLISAHMLGALSKTWGKDTTAALYNRLSEEMKSSTYGKAALNVIQLSQPVGIGDRYADFEQGDTTGKPVRLSDFEGKVVLLEFWGSWCGPCRKSNPQLEKVYQEFKAKGFEILGVASDTDRDAWLKAIGQDGISWTNVSDLQGSQNKAAVIYGINYYPSNFLIDRTGKIIARDLKPGKLRERLKKIL